MSAPLSGGLSGDGLITGGPGITYPSTDSMLGPVLQGLATIASQVQGVGTIYTESPEGAPDDNSVMFPVKRWAITNWTNGTAQIAWEIDITHVFIMTRFQDDLARMQTFIAPWLYTLSSLSNTILNDAAILTDVQNGQFIQYVHSGQPYLALVHTVRVLTEFALYR